MKPVRTQQRFQCDFCSRRSTKTVMEIHEKRCFRNPNRFCDACGNTGKQKVEVGELNGQTYYEDQPCFYCSKFDPKMLEEIMERESKLL